MDSEKNVPINIQYPLTKSDNLSKNNIETQKIWVTQGYLEEQQSWSGLQL